MLLDDVRGAGTPPLPTEGRGVGVEAEEEALPASVHAAVRFRVGVLRKGEDRR